MLIMTMIARVADGLPLSASIQEDEQVSIFGIILRLFLAVESIFTFIKSVVETIIEIMN